MPIPECGCWLWIGADKGPYGNFYYEGKLQSAHRVAWKLYNGIMPKNLLVLHHCDTPLCVNPRHLFLGTQKDNLIDANKKKRPIICFQKGENHPLAKLKSLDIENIKHDCRYQKIIAIDYNISQQQVSRIKGGKRWNKN